MPTYTFLCVSPRGALVRSGLAPNSLVKGELQIDQVVDGSELHADKRTGALRLKIDDTQWVLVYNGSEALLRSASRVDAFYMCIHPGGAEVRREFAADSGAVEVLNFHSLVHGVLTCKDAAGCMHVKLDSGCWSCIHDQFAHFLQPIKLADELYVCVSDDVVLLRDGLPASSECLGRLSSSEVVQGAWTCLDVEGCMQLMLDDGSWACIQDAAHQYLRPATGVDAYYMCVSTESLAVRSGFSVGSSVIGHLHQEQIVHGVLLCDNESGVTRLQLESGNWTSVCSGTRTFLRLVTPAIRHYLCVSPRNVSVRTGFAEKSPVVGEVLHGEVVRGVLTCLTCSGALRLKMEVGKWISLHAADASQPLLLEAAAIDENYLCVGSAGLFAQKGFPATSARVGTLPFGEVVRAVLSCVNTEGVTRLKLEDGSWTTFLEDALRPVKHVDAVYLCTCPKGAVVRSSHADSGNVVGELAPEQTVRGAMLLSCKDGSSRLMLDNGSWVAVHAGDATRPMLRPVTVLDRRYVCVSPKAVRVTSTFASTGAVSGQIHEGQVVRGVVACLNGKGDIRLKLANGKWTTVQSGNDSSVLLEPCSEEFLLELARRLQEASPRRSLSLSRVGSSFSPASRPSRGEPRSPRRSLSLSRAGSSFSPASRR
mmetsp:Transcript_67715/g.191638  ORF Transcript_67715/g.191638 Transcript_67715/m.191638 type:complete len:651 (-) Transcript_67715:36-1988(-)